MGDPVQKTNEDATFCKRSAVHYGYWNDPYLEAMLPWSSSNFGGEARKAPEIHLGYYTRVRGLWTLIDRIVSLCLQSDCNYQIVNLGAGYDTLYWRLKESVAGKLLQNFVDVDLPEVTASKCALVKRSKLLLERVADGEGEVHLPNNTDLHGTDYHIVACDFTRTSDLEKKLEACNWNYNVPTVFVSECVFIYLDPEKVTDFLKWIKLKFDRSGVALLNHEQLNMNGRFGQVMMENLSQRGCGLPGVASCKDKMSQCNRFTIDSGWSGAQCWSMNDVYNYLPKEEIARVERLEFLDERELVKQLFEHYCITFAWINGENTIKSESETLKSSSIHNCSTSDPLNFDDLDIW